MKAIALKPSTTAAIAIIRCCGAFLIMELKVSMIVEVNADSKVDAENAIMQWIIDNLPTVLEEDDIIINDVRFC